MLHTVQFLATFCAALFAGAALYINVAEHPARMGLETRIAAKQWAPSYKRATWLQAPLALLSFAAGGSVWLMGGGVAWLVAAVLVGAVVPVTLLVIFPTNNKLLAPGRALALLKPVVCLSSGVRCMLSAVCSVSSQRPCSYGCWLWPNLDMTPASSGTDWYPELEYLRQTT